MRIGAMAAFATWMVGLSLFGLAPASASEALELNLQIPGETPLHNGQGQPVLIAGVWHDLSFALGSPVQDRLIIEISAPDAQAGNMSGHYVWERDERTGSWSDLLYGFFIQPELSRSTGERILFRLGIDAASTPGTWRIVITQDGAPLGDRLIEVRAPRMGYGMSTADFHLRGEPFEAAELSSADRAQYLRIINNGNVPLRFSVTFDRLKSRLRLLNPSDVVHIQSETKYFLGADLDARPPQIIEVQGTARVEVSDLIPSPGATQIVPAIESVFGLKVVIGRSGYTIQPLGDLVFQTIDGLRADYDSVVTWQVYLTGDQDVSLDVRVTGARLVGVYQSEARLNLPAVLRPRATSELPLTLRVMTDLPSTVAEVVFTLQIPGTAEIGTFRTIIIVGPKPAPSPLAPSYLWLIASLMTASVLALVSYNHLRLGSTAGRKQEAGKGPGRARAPAKGGKGPEGRKRTRGKRKSPKKREGAKGRKGGKKKRDTTRRTRRGRA